MLKSVLLATALIGMGCALNLSGQEPMTAASSKQKMNEKTMPEGAKSIVVAGGCFWCVETIYDQLKGVYWAESGYAGGNRPNANYEIVMTGITGHADGSLALGAMVLIGVNAALWALAYRWLAAGYKLKA